MAVGDGGGVLPVPSPDQTALINEQYRAPLNRLVIADRAANVIRAEMIMPPQAGGFWIREAALFDETGICGGGEPARILQAASGGRVGTFPCD